MFQIGDRVAVVDQEVEGVVCSFDDNKVTIESSEGFVLDYLPKDLVKIGAEIQVTNHQAYVAKQSKESIKQRSNNVVKHRNKTILEVDLHIEKLVNSWQKLDAFDILELQLKTAQQQLNFAQSKHIKTVILIHGYGAGVLKKELESLLHRFSAVTFSEASYQKYGLGGATEVHFN